MNGNVAILVGNVLRGKRIRDMEIGDRGYTVPWAFDPDTGNLDESYTISDFPRGTATLKVECGGKGAYKVTIDPDDDYRW